MKILVLSHTAWNSNNSFGNSFSNIFEGIEDIKIANIYCNYGSPNNRIVEKHFQITEKSLLRNLINKKYPSGKEVNAYDQYDQLHDSENKILKSVQKKKVSNIFLDKRCNLANREMGIT